MFTWQVESLQELLGTESSLLIAYIVDMCCSYQRLNVYNNLEPAHLCVLLFRHWNALVNIDCNSVLFSARCDNVVSWVGWGLVV